MKSNMCKFLRYFSILKSSLYGPRKVRSHSWLYITESSADECEQTIRLKGGTMQFNQYYLTHARTPTIVAANTSIVTIIANAMCRICTAWSLYDPSTKVPIHTSDTPAAECMLTSLWMRCSLSIALIHFYFQSISYMFYIVSNCRYFMLVGVVVHGSNTVSAIVVCGIQTGQPISTALSTKLR